MTYDLPSTAPHHALLDNLSQQSSLLTALFTHLSQPLSSNPSPLAIPPIPSFPSTSSPSDPLNTIYAALAERERDLAGIVSRTYEHQAAYASLMRKRDEVSGLERRVRGLVKALERDRKELEGMVQSGEEIRESIAKSEKDPLPVKPLLAHAQALATHSSAPVSSLLTPLDRANALPWPTEAAMRQGLLFALQGSMSGVGDVGKIGDETKEVPAETRETQREVIHEDTGRRFDPNAVFELDLNSDSEED
ncbi:hypothetical protein EHS25_000113 [Saitozyma podzolica]|uniref:Mediator of RNA polymerase II transcription subunit 4 n=1 Tax=Saitozyma podzolica TaxID=1890683 RepID=A0A427YVA8_9TREE|nr:hypothetical protein EHS25_000113 [Saitozyma podzolica]